MISKLLAWFDNRTGYREFLHEALYERVPGGARWRYVWGSTLVFTFLLQVITGLVLWSAYCPSVQTAWESVFYIQNEMTLGYVVRGIHHYTAHTMVILLAIHLAQVIIDGAYRAPREINFWLGLILMQIILALALTGYLLPWDQKGYYATQVSTKIVGATPWIGPQVQTLLQGGSEYGHPTLSRFFALHAGLLPWLLMGCLVLHVMVFRRHGITVRDSAHAPDATFWPDQVLKDAVACLGVLGVILLLALFRGAELSAPANPAEAFAAARPETYFLFLFRFLKFQAVEHYGLAFGAIYVPAAIMTVIALMPIIAYFKGGHRFNVAFLGIIAVGVVGLTVLALVEDRNNADHQVALREAHRDGVRAREMALRPEKIPVEGAAAMLRHDPFTQGPRLFAKHCSHCHHFNGHDGRGRQVFAGQDSEGRPLRAQPTAPDLGNFGSRQWMRAVLVDFENHFAPLKNSSWYQEVSRGESDAEFLDPDNSEMADWSGDRQSLISGENTENLSALIEFLVAEAGHVGVSVDPNKVQQGRRVAVDGQWTGDLEGTSCADCHSTIGEAFDPDSDGDGSGYPDIAQYASAVWLADFLAHPGAERHYGSKNQMPSQTDKMAAEQLNLLVRWMVGDYYRTPTTEKP